MEKTGGMVRRALALALLVGSLAVPGAWGEGRLFSVGPLGITLPPGWFPLPEGDGGWGFGTGGLPEGPDPFLSVMLRVVPNDQEFQEFRKQIDASRKDPQASVDIVEEGGRVGPWEGTQMRFSVTMKGGERAGTSFQGSLFFSQGGVSGDQRLMVLVGGDPTLAREREAEIASILGSLREGGASYVLSPDLLLESSPGEFDGAAAMAVDGEGLIYVANWRQRTIRVLDLQGHVRVTWGKEGKGEPGTFAQIKTLEGLREGGVLVGDGGYGYDAPALQACDAAGNFQQRIDLSGKAKPPLEYMLSLSRNASGDLLVADGDISEGNRLTVLAPDGAIQRSWTAQKLTAAAWEPSGTVVASQPPALQGTEQAGIQIGPRPPGRGALGKDPVRRHVAGHVPTNPGEKLRQGFGRRKERGHRENLLYVRGLSPGIRCHYTLRGETPRSPGGALHPKGGYRHAHIAVRLSLSSPRESRRSPVAEDL